MKYLFIFLLVPLLSQGQKGSYLGVYANTGIYKLYNYNDWHTNKASDQFGLIIDPQKSDVSKLYNSTFGISFGHSYNERNSIEMSLGLANFRQDYVLDKTFDIRHPVFAYDYAKLRYGTFTANWYHNFIRRSASEIRPAFYIMGGIQISYLMNYFEKEYSSDQTTHGLISQSVTIDNGEMHGILEAPGQPTIYNFSSTESIFNKYLLGINLGVGIEKSISDRLNLRLGCTFKYDLINSENNSAKAFTDKGLSLDYYRNNSRIPSTYSSSERKSTHNIYYGFGFSFAWYLKRQSY